MRKVLIMVFVFVMLFTISPGYGMAAQSSPDSLTVEEAVNLALSNSKDLKKALLDVDAAEITRDETWDDANAALMSAYDSGTGLYISVPTGSSETQVYSANYSYLSKQSSYNTKKEAITIAVYQKYYNILNALDSLESKRLASQQDTEKLRIAQVRCQLGLDTNAALYQAQLQAESSQAELATAQKDLDEEYINFMQYIGLSSDSRPSLDNNVAYTPADIENAETEIDSIVDDSPTLWLADESVRVQEKTYGSSGNYELDDINLDIADYTVDLTREEMEQATRGIYYKLKNVEDSYQAAVEGTRTAEEALRVTKLMYDVGTATKVDVMSAEASVCTARNSLNSLIRNHEILKMSFAKPWAAGV